MRVLEKKDPVAGILLRGFRSQRHIVNQANGCITFAQTGSNKSTIIAGNHVVNGEAEFSQSVADLFVGESTAQQSVVVAGGVWAAQKNEAGRVSFTDQVARSYH